jgi:orotate phosphoribosyltransferase
MKKIGTDDFGQHEVVHTASIIVDMISSHIMEHPAVEANPRWTHLAEKALEAMMAVYQETATNTALRQMLKELIIEKSFRKGNFTLASGKASNYFFDMKPTMLDPSGSNLIGTLILDKITEISVDHRANVVGGMAMGAIPLVSVVSSKSHQTNFPVKGFFVRKQAKDHGTEQIIEGELFEGDRVICLEDVTTSGGSVMIAINAARATGCCVDNAITIVDRLEGAEAFLQAVGVTLHSIFTIEDFA